MSTFCSGIFLCCSVCSCSVHLLLRLRLCILRFTCGLGLGMVIAGVVTLSAEVSPPSKRGRFMSEFTKVHILNCLSSDFDSFLFSGTSF